MALKRNSTAGKPAAKRSRTENKVPTVVAALSHSDALPLGLRSLLKVVLPIALNANKADRHAYETEVVDQAEKALAAVEAALVQQHGEALAKQNEMIAPQESAKRSAAKAAAEAHLEATKEALEARKAAKKAGEKAVQEAEHALKAAQAEAKHADKELQRFLDKKAALSDALATEFALLKEGSSAAAAGKTALKKVLALAKSFASTTMLQTFPLACKKLGASRTEFESSVFNSMQGLIEREIAATTEKVGEFEPPKVAKDAAVTQAKETLENAEASLKTASEELNAAQASQKEATKELSKADAVLCAIWEDMRQVCDAQDALANDVKHFKENIWGAFNALKEKEPEPEPVEEEAPVMEEAPVDAAMADAAPAAPADEVGTAPAVEA